MSDFHPGLKWESWQAWARPHLRTGPARIDPVTGKLIPGKYEHADEIEHAYAANDPRMLSGNQFRKSAQKWRTQTRNLHAHPSVLHCPTMRRIHTNASLQPLCWMTDEQVGVKYTFAIPIN